MPLAIIVNCDTKIFKFYNVERLLNKNTIKKGKGHVVEYLVCWTGYGLE